MSKFNSPLNNIYIASPCSADWNEMYGNERKRFCGECKLNVFNLSGMTKTEAENLIINSEGRLCVRFYRRNDGSVITKDCPVGWAKVKQRSKAVATAVFSLIATLFGGLLFASIFTRENRSVEVGKLVPAATPTPAPSPEYPIMGKIAMPSPTPKQKPTPKTEERWVMGEMPFNDIERQKRS